ESLGAATVERYFRRVLKRQFTALRPPRCPRILGIDEHFFTRRKGFATTLCDLKNHTIYDVVLGRSEASLDANLQSLQSQADVLVVCMDVSATYRGRPLPRYPAGQSSFPELLATDGSACQQEPRPAQPDAPSPPPPQTRSAPPPGCLFSPKPSPG